MQHKAVPRRIAIVLPDLRGGGVERVRLLLAGEFLARGYDVDLVLMRPEGELLAELDPRVRLVDLRSSRLRQALPALTRYFREARPDAALAAMWPLTGLACLAKRASGGRFPLVVSEHNDLRLVPAIGRLERALLRGLGRWIYAPGAVVAVSHGVAESLQACAGVPRERVAVIHNPIRPVERTQPDAADADLFRWWAGAPRRLLAIGSLKPQKGFDVLIEALAARPHPDAHLVILGEGPMRAELEALVRVRGLEDRVRLPGFRRDPYPFLSLADLFVLSSRWEGLGNVIIEALACGVPVVSTDCLSGPSEILEAGRYGTLAPVGDSAALAEAIAAALASDHDREALKRRAAAFTPAAAAERYLSLLFPDDQGAASVR